MAATGVRAQRGLRITLADVARLARVQRPVVSMWRTRYAASDAPFPSSVATDGRVASFDGEAVVSWLAQTGRGKNAHARDDLAAFARPAGASPRGEEAHLRAVSALLCLKAVTGVQLGGLAPADLQDLADEVDGDDEFLVTEIADLADEATGLASYVDGLADAAYSPALAFEQLMADRFRHHLPGHAQTALRDDARHLVARIAQGLAQSVDLQPAVFADPTRGGSDLLVEVARLYAEESAPTVMTRAEDGEIGRLVRRRLRVHDLHREPLVVAVDGVFDLSGPAVHLAHFPSAGAPGMTEVDVLAAIDNLVLRMDQRQLGVIVAPASVLTDRLVSVESGRFRDGLLRSDRVRAILRLPKGLLVGASRQPLALWALGPPHPDVRISDRWTVVSDLADVRLDDAAIDDLVTDVVAAMGDYHFVLSHSFRFARRANTRVLLARGRSLVEDVSRVRPRPIRAEADTAVRAGELTRSLGLADVVGQLSLDADGPGQGDPSRDPLTVGMALMVGRALSRRALLLVAGNRVDETDLHADSGARVIGPGELTGAMTWGGRRVDRLAFAGTYPSGRLTVPGDVVFCTSPRAAARVDVEGGSVVLSPARVLRVPAGGPAAGAEPSVVPEVLAADLNTVASGAKAWRLWTVRRAPAAQAAALSASLRTIERERQDARRRLTELDELAGHLADGVTQHRLTIHQPASHQPQEGR